MIRQHGRSTVPGGRHRQRSAAPWAAACVVVMSAALVVAGGGSAAAAQPNAGSAVLSPLGLNVDVSAKPTTNLPATNAEITVRGSGFDSSGELWIAVCQDDGMAPGSLTHCLGGAIPDDNASSAWAVITKDGNPPYAGPVIGTWAKKGSFAVTLQIPVAVGQDADCVSSPCAIYTRSADDADRSQDAKVPVSFTFAGSSSPGAPSTEVIGSAPTTVAPDSVAADEAPVGSDQVVTFSGFTPGEVVDSAIYSDPIPLPPVQADPSGGVTISFTVPEDLPPGTHLVQAIGRQSGRVGVAQFSVVAAAATTESTQQTTATATDLTAMTTPSTSLTSATELVLAPPTTGTSSGAATSSAEGVTTSVIAAAPTGSDESGAARLIWLWVVLGALVLIGGAAAVAVMLRRRRDDAYRAAPPEQEVDEVLAAPSWHTMGSDDPALAAPGLLAGQWTPGLEDGAADPGPATEQWTPGFDDGAAAGPSDPGPATEQWTPRFDDGDQPGPSGTGRHHRSP